MAKQKPGLNDLMAWVLYSVVIWFALPHVGQLLKRLIAVGEGYINGLLG